MKTLETAARSLALPDDIPAAVRPETAALGARFLEASGRDALPGDFARAFAASPFLAEYAIREPEAFTSAVESPEVDTDRGGKGFDALVAAALAEAGEDLAAAKRTLRRLRNHEFVRLAWRDLRCGTAVETVMAELSAFADAVLRGAVPWLRDRLAPRFGHALAADGTPMQLLVLGMGKLGGNELNFSSDVDLIFVYERAGTTQGGRRELDHQDYFDRLGRELISLLNEVTPDGFVFRVDMRLRPFGDSGALTSSLGALEQYYTVHGRDWERYALIKSRAITGDRRCRAALGRIVRPFVFRRYLDYGALDALREMKALINREARSDQVRYDVKRGYGGIREIEFVGQLFQLTRGGRDARLRVRSILKVLRTCGELGLLERDEVELLCDAYRFLRTVEHRLQEVADQQTHRVPEEHAERERLAFALGLPDWPALAVELARHRDATNALFDSLLRPQNAEASLDTSALETWRELWSGPIERDRIEARAADADFDIDSPFVDVLAELRTPKFLSRLSAQGRKRLDRLMPLLLEHAHMRDVPAATVRRLANLIHAIARRSVYLAFLADNPGALKRLVELFDASPWIAEEITRYPILMDELLDSRVLYRPPAHDELAQRLAEQLVDADGLEAEMEVLRSFKSQQVLRVAASDITDHFPVAEVSNQLSWIAEACVQAALDIAWADISARHGTPWCTENGERRRAGFAVLGYGKLGGLELGYGSDLDLVFVHDSRGEAQRTDGDREVENNVFFTRLAQRLIHVLGTPTAFGATYEIDIRLRPSGAAGQVVPSMDAFRNYQLNDAWVWEHQALVRARSIAGDSAVREAFAAVRADVLSTQRDEAELKASILEMRERMRGEVDRTGQGRFDLKQGEGGITDIEFVVQYAVLRWACRHPGLLAWTDNLRLLETIAELGLLSGADCAALHDAYFAYRADIHRCALQQIDGLVDDDAFRDHRRAVAEVWNRVFG